MDNIIDVKGLKRSFKTPKNGEFEAIKGIDFSDEEGEIFGLLGPNGAGKTTTIKNFDYDACSKRRRSKSIWV